MTRPDITETTDDGTVCSVDGAVVHVRRRRARGDVPAFEYLIGTDEDSPVAVRLRQPLPSSVEPDALGFPPPCEDDWRVDDATLVFEAPIEPGDPVRTAWGVDADDHPGIEPPEIDVVPFDPSGAAGGEAAAAENEAVVGDADADEASSTLELSEPSESGLSEPDAGSGGGPSGGSGSTDATAGEIDAPDPSPLEDDAASAPAGSAPSTATGSSAPGAEAVTDGTVVAQLVADLQSTEVDDRHREALQDALAVRLSDSTNAFVEHLQEKLERRAQRLADEIESLEESIERVYGVKADASEVDALKRGLSELDESTVDAAEIEDLRATSAEVAERLAAVQSAHEELETKTARADHLAELADRVGDLRAEVQQLRESAATETEVEELAGRVDDLADSAATAEDVEEVREAHRGAVNSTKSDVAALRQTLQSDYRSDAEISAEIDRRLKQSLATLVLFGIGATGLLSTVPLALAESDGAAVTFAGGALSILAWWAYLGRQGGFSRFARALPSPGDLLGE